FMQSKNLVRFYGEHCSRTIARIAGCENKLTDLNAQLQVMYEQMRDMQYQLSALWDESLGKTILQREIYTLKRKEALLMSRQEELKLQLQEHIDSMNDVAERRDDFIKLRLHYEKKKKKWEWMSGRSKQMRIRKDIRSDEL